MRAEMEELQGAKNQLERICFSMADDIRTLKMKVDQQSAEIGTVSSDMRNRSKKLEDDNRNQVRSKGVPKDADCIYIIKMFVCVVKMITY